MPLDEAYFVWLYSQVGSTKNRNRSGSYWQLLKLLFEKEFTWSNSMEKDENRAQDGKDLRREFLRDDNNLQGQIALRKEAEQSGWLDYDCSVLEMMIALSWKLAFEGEGEPRDWFWTLIKNLGLLECTDANPPEPIIVDRILNKIINREYACNGAGGLFPLTDMHGKQDQREVELWYQAQAYILERI